MDNLQIGYVYIITNPNGKMYIGSTNNIKRRWSEYKRLHCKRQIKLYNSLKKYGSENHIFEIVYKGNIENIFKYERLIGEFYEVINIGLNCELPGYNDVRAITSKETREKQSKSAKGKILSEETKFKISIANKGNKHTEEAKRKIGIASKNRISGRFGKKISEEHKLIISNHMKQLWKQKKMKKYLKKN